MAKTCTSPSEKALVLEKYLKDHFGTQDFDLPLEATRFTPGGGPERIVLPADGCKTTADVYERAFQTIAQCRSQPGSQSCDDYQHFLSAQLSIPLSISPAVRRRLMPSDLHRKGFALAKSLFRRIVSTPGHHGLGIHFDRSDASPVRSSEQILAGRKATCLDFTNLFLAALESFGIDAVPIELFRDAWGHDHTHLMVGLRDPETKQVVLMVDLEDRYFGPPRQGDQWVVISERERFSYVLNRRGVTSGKPNEVKAAYEMNPASFLLNNNMAWFAQQRGDLVSAQQFWGASLTFKPDQPEIARNLISRGP